MEEQLYRISDVATMLNLKSHVIRNWESELGIETPRSDCGHRYYTQKQIDTFISIKKLKEHGFSLKQIRLLLPNLDSLGNADDKTLAVLKSRLDSCKLAESIADNPAGSEQNFASHKNTSEISMSAPSLQKLSYEEIRCALKDIITDAITENIDAISKEIGHNVSEMVSKEMNYQLIQHENIVNDRLKALENTLTGKQKPHKFRHFGFRSKFANRVSSDCHLS